MLVYDLGGGTFDLAFVAHDGTGCYQLAMEHDGNPHCGGDDMDRALYDYWDRQVRQSTGEPISLVDGQVDLYFLLQCQRRKENLSGWSRRKKPAPFRSPVPGGRIAKLEIDRPTFERLIRSQVEQTVERTRRMYERALQAGHEVDTVLLIGGASQVPLVQERLCEALPVEPRSWTAQGVAVALGAAHYCHELWNCHELWTNSEKGRGNRTANRSGNENGQPEDDKEGSPKDIVTILGSHFAGLPNVYVRPDIPPRKLQNVQGLYPGEDIYLVYDRTVFGGAKDGFVITGSGIGWRNDAFSEPQFLAFSKADPDQVSGGNSEIELAPNVEACSTWTDEATALAAALSETVRAVKSGA